MTHTQKKYIYIQFICIRRDGDVMVNALDNRWTSLNSSSAQVIMLCSQDTTVCIATLSQKLYPPRCIIGS